VSEQERKELISRLTSRSIDDFTFDRINKLFPLAVKCPTCNDEGAYRLDGSIYECDCELQKMLQRHYFAANIGRAYHTLCIDHFLGDDREAVAPTVLDYIENFEDNFQYGVGITFAGEIGTGKTMLMSFILKELVKQGRKVYTVPFEQLINVFGSAYSNDESKRLMEQLMSVEVLGLDELRSDSRNKSGFLSDALDVLIRHRTSNLLPTLVTTNMTPQQEQDEFGKTYSLLSALNYRLIFHGEDKRGNEIRERERKLKDAGERRPIC
jgi:DNA replication protein DnaC